MTTKLQDLQYRAIETINRMVECDESSFEDRCRAIELVRKHLEERAKQCGGSIALADLIGEMI